MAERTSYQTIDRIVLTVFRGTLRILAGQYQRVKVSTSPTQRYEPVQRSVYNVDTLLLSRIGSPVSAFARHSIYSFAIVYENLVYIRLNIVDTFVPAPSNNRDTVRLLPKAFVMKSNVNDIMNHFSTFR